MGEVRPQGTIRFKGRDIAGLPSYKIAHCGLAMCREHRDIFPGLTVRQNLVLGIKDVRRPGKWRLESMLEMFPNLAARARYAGRRLVRRRETDADDLPDPDGRSRTHHDRRADRRPGALIVQQVGDLIARIAAAGVAIPPGRTEAVDRAPYLPPRLRDGSRPHRLRRHAGRTEGQRCHRKEWLEV